MHAAYSATKAFLDFFSQAIAKELQGSVDVMTLKPGYVKTKMIRLPLGQDGCIPVEECVAGALRDLGQGRETFANWFHEVQGTVMRWMLDMRPQRIAQAYCHRFGLDKAKKE